MGKAVSSSRLYMLFTSFLLLQPASGTPETGREEQYLLKRTITTKIIKKSKLTQIEKSEWGSAQKSKAATEPIKRLTQPHVRARGNSTATNTTDCLRTHTRSQMLCLGIHLPQVGIEIPGLSSWEEEEQVQYGNIKQRSNWTGFGFVCLFLMQGVIYKTPIFHIVLPSCMSGFAYNNEKKRHSANIKNGPQLHVSQHYCLRLGNRRKPSPHSPLQNKPSDHRLMRQTDPSLSCNGDRPAEGT